MPRILIPERGKTLEQSYAGRSYTNDDGVSQCVEFIQQTLGAPVTTLWNEGKKISESDNSTIAGTPIATFINHKYSHLGSPNQHAAIYLSQDAEGIHVLDQWPGHNVGPRVIPWKPHRPGLSNNGNAFSVIVW
jgi:hypothetical protein